MKPINIREIIPADNPAISKIIKATLTEFGAYHPGTVYYDPSTDHLFELFREPGSVYYIAETIEGQFLSGVADTENQHIQSGDADTEDQPLLDGIADTKDQHRPASTDETGSHRLLGGVGIFPTYGLPQGTCELVKMYLVPEARGKGLGKSLIERALAFAKNAGYVQVYIETMPELQKAMTVYEKFGFRYLEKPLGNSGHFGCQIWMLKNS